MSESTPLLTRRPQRRRSLPALPTLKRFIYISTLSTITLVIVITTSLTALLLFPLGPGHTSLWSRIHSGFEKKFLGTVSHEEFLGMLKDTPDPKKAREWSSYYTAGPHLAGKNKSQAIWTRDLWESFGIESRIDEYDVYINYPNQTSLSLNSHGKTIFNASLEEDILPEDPTTNLTDRIPIFHGYSGSGSATGQFVYVNYGTYADFADLQALGINLTNKIALARYGGIFRGLKVKRAEELGMAGVILFTDPGDDGEITEENGYLPYPEGPARNPSSVQRGSTQYLSIRPGDPTTPGYPSKPGVPRIEDPETIPKIPSIPISFRDAVPILKALNGHGPASKDLGHPWSRNQGLAHLGVSYNVGPSPAHITLSMDNQQTYETTPLWNVIGVLNGTLSDDVIVVGNHRDAWIAGGAVDPNSGSAVLNEVIRSFSVASSRGWRPLRTVIFASWDGEEYGLVGSTEWVEEFLPWLSGANVAYVNVDVGVGGPHFHAAAAPLLHPLLHHATTLVSSPNQTIPGQTISSLWDGRIAPLGSGSDYTAFQDYAGIPSIDMGFSASGDSAAYHYHSNYDSFYWMENFGDPGFLYHKAMAQLTGVVVGELVGRPIVPLRAVKYAEELSKYIDIIEDKLSGSSISEDPETALFTSRSHPPLIGPSKTPLSSVKRHLSTLRKTLSKFHAAATTLDALAISTNSRLAAGFKWYKFWQVPRVLADILLVNHRYKLIERAFIYQEGLDGREWFKHVVFAPGLWTGYAGAVFPGLIESIQVADWDNTLRWISIIDTCFTKATTAATSSPK